MVWLNNDINNNFSLIILSSLSYGRARSLMIVVAKAKLFPKLQLLSKLKTKLYLKTGLD